MIKSGDWLRMNWNGKPFADHPPMGMWLIALSYTLFGVSELATRLPSVIAGILTTLLMHKTGILLSGRKVVGWIAAIVLMTSVWYVIRVRSGNLDSLFVFFYICTIYTALKSRENVKWFPVVGILFGALILTKTLVGVSALPLIALTNWQHILHLRKSIVWLLGGVFSFFCVVLPWYYTNWYWYPDFYTHHFIVIGTRGKTADSYLHLQYELPLFYLHMGVRKWYWVWVASIVFLLGTYRFIKKEIGFVFVWNAIVLYPFLTTDQTHIWHLIPVYIPLALVIALAGNEAIILFNQTANFLSKKFLISLPVKLLLFQNVFASVLIIGATVIGIWQFQIFYHEVFPSNRYIPDDVDISLKASRYDQAIYFDDDYLPIAVFYSGKFMKQMAYEADERKTLVNLFNSSENDFIVITRNWALNNLKENNLKFNVLESNNSFSIVERKQ